MLFSDVLSLSTRMFKNRPMRTFLTILGVGVGIGAVVFLVSLGYGIQNVILNRITTADSLLSLDVTSGTSEIIRLNKEKIDEMRKIPEVSEVSPMSAMLGQMSIGEFASDGAIYIVEPSFFRLGGIMVNQGELIDEKNNNNIVISSVGAQLFNLEPNEALGKKLKLTLFITNKDEDGIERTEEYKIDKEFTVKGIVEDENVNYIYILRNAFENIDIDDFEQVKIKVKDEIEMESVRDKIIEMGFLVSSLSDTIDQARKIFGIIQIILALFGFVALIVSAIGMFNTMTITLLERTNEIGIMRAIGITRRDVRYLFLFESILMGFLGGVVGIGIGYLGGWVVNFGFNMLAQNFGGQAFDLFFIPNWFIASVVGFSTVIGFLTGVYPSRRAAKLNPLEALRYK